MLLLVFVSASSFALYVLDAGMDWIDNAQILSQGISVLVMVSILGHLPLIKALMSIY
jgi:preprotein translocase subunit SecE